MKQEILKHKAAYLILVAGLLVFVGLFFTVWPNRTYQRLVILMLMGFYVSWGCIMHVKSDHITKNIVYEYVSVSLLAGVLLFFITL